MYGYEKGQPMAENQGAMQDDQMQAPPDAAADQPMDAEADEMQQLEQIAQSAPAPTKPFTVKVLNTLLDTFNKSLEKISTIEMPKIELDFENTQNGKMDAPIPGELFLPLIAIAELVRMVKGGEFESKYAFDPFTILTDTDLRKVTAILKMMAKDKKFIEAVKELQEGGGEMQQEGDEGPDDMAPPPNEMGVEDEMLAEGMQ